LFTYLIIYLLFYKIAPPRAVQERDEDLESKMKASAKEKIEGVQSEEDENEEKDGGK
jgi:hypothetical protein